MYCTQWYKCDNIFLHPLTLYTPITSILVIAHCDVIFGLLIILLIKISLPFFWQGPISRQKKGGRGGWVVGIFWSHNNGWQLNDRGFSRSGMLSLANFSIFGVGLYLKYGHSLYISHQEWCYWGFCSTQGIQQSPHVKCVVTKAYSSKMLYNKAVLDHHLWQRNPHLT